MTMKKIAVGDYCSYDGRFRIKRNLSQQTGHATEVCWTLYDYEKNLGESETKREAVALMLETKKQR